MDTRNETSTHLESAELERLHETRIVGRIVAKESQLVKSHFLDGILNTTLSQYLE